MNATPSRIPTEIFMRSLLVCLGIVLSHEGFAHRQAGVASAHFPYRVARLSAEEKTPCHGYGINAQGQIVGAMATAASGGFYVACSYTHGQIREYGAGRASNAVSINSKGEAVGEAHAHATLYYEGHIRDLGTLGGAWSRAYAINEQGWIVGESATADGHSQAFLYKDDKMRSLGSLGGGYSIAYGINNRGQIVGRAQDAQGAPHAFLYSQGKMQNLGTLAGHNLLAKGGATGDAESVAYAINDKGQIVGGSQTNVFVEPSPDVQVVRQTHAFLWSRGKMRDIDSSGSKFSQAYAINNRGLVVGEEGGEAVLWQAGKAQKLSQLTTPNPLTLGVAYGINERGEIVGQGELHGHDQAYLLVPLALYPQVLLLRSVPRDSDLKSCSEPTPEGERGGQASFHSSVASPGY